MRLTGTFRRPPSPAPVGVGAARAGCARWLSFTALALSCGAAAADNLFDLSLEELVNLEVTISTGIDQPLHEAPSVAAVITAADIRAIGATDLDEVLDTVAGLHVSRRSFAYEPTYIFRGVYSDNNSQVLFLINGIPITNVFAGDRSQVWAGMPVNAIERIEVIRGPGSALYGADAFGGVVNIITRGGADIAGAELGARVGRFNRLESWVLLGGEAGGLDVSFTAELTRTDGPGGAVEADRQSTFDQRFGSDASLAPGEANRGREGLDARLDVAAARWRMRLGYQGRRDVETGSGGTEVLDPRGRMAADRVLADFSYDHPDFSEDWGLRAAASVLHSNWRVDETLRLFPPGATIPTAFGPVSFPEGVLSAAAAYENNYRLSLSGDYHGFRGHSLQLGAGYLYADLYDVENRGNPVPGGGLEDLAPLVPEKSRRNWHVYLRDLWRLAGNWQLTLGLRYDAYSDVGSTINPRVGVIWEPRPELSGKLLYGSAFRPPSFAALYATGNPVALGNPTLDPETIDWVELGADYRPATTLRVAASLFYYEWRDKIVFVSAGGGTRRAQNHAAQDACGGELEMQWEPGPALRVTANYAFQRAEDLETGDDPGFAPGHQVYLRGDYRAAGDFTLSAQLNWVADRERSPVDERRAIADYRTVDLTLRRAAPRGGGLEWALSLRNLFDEDAREPSTGPESAGFVSIPADLPLAGRSAYLELRYRY